jgi:hypothetical protein
MPSAEPGILLREIRRLTSSPGLDAPPDRVLLEQFINRGDESSFALLVGRHGPMVYGAAIKPSMESWIFSSVSPENERLSILRVSDRWRVVQCPRHPNMP